MSDGSVDESVAREAIAALSKAHEWLERVDQRAEGYFGLDHKLGKNEDGCDFCHAVAMLEGRVEPLSEGSY
jgi:hypothetical protein